MFYSHEILNNSQYGVATIWQIATVGKARKITKRAIQDVNVPKACEKIIEPGAPLALRLQGSLLYGLARVFSQQTNYVLSDAEKIQFEMMTFFRRLAMSETDPKAGKAKRHQITLEDDPNFDPMSILPKLDLFSTSGDLSFLSSQYSTQKASQLSPLGSLHQTTPPISGAHPLFDFNLPPSSRSAQSYHLPSDFGHRSSPFPKGEDAMADFVPFGDDEIELGGINLDFDDDGNLIGVVENENEPELPLLPGTEAHNAQVRQQVVNSGADGLEQDRQLGGGEELLIMGEQPLPDAEPFPKRATAKRPDNSSSETSSTIEVKRAVAHAKRGRRRKFQNMVDQSTRVSGQEFRGWATEYLENMEASRRKRPKLVNTQAQARKHALGFLFENGLANVGLINVASIGHPLADMFAGVSLKARLQGRYPEEGEELSEHRGRRRASAEAFEDEDEEQRRRVKQRVDDKPDPGRGIGDDLGLLLGDNSIELGMEAAPALEDRHSSSMMPWSRPPSAVPGSSVRGFGSAQKVAVAQSPLLGRGSVARPIEHHSDLSAPALGSDNFPLLHSHDSSLEFNLPLGLDTQKSAEHNDNPSHEFLAYATEKARAYTPDASNRSWIDFEELASPVMHSSDIAAQAFFHILSLATKNIISVMQEGIEEDRPFGVIRVGLPIADHHEAGESEDELA